MDRVFFNGFLLYQLSNHINYQDAKSLALTSKNTLKHFNEWMKIRFTKEAARIQKWWKQTTPKFDLDHNITVYDVDDAEFDSTKDMFKQIKASFLYQKNNHLISRSWNEIVDRESFNLTHALLDRCCCGANGPDLVFMCFLYSDVKIKSITIGTFNHIVDQKFVLIDHPIMSYLGVDTSITVTLESSGNVSIYTNGIFLLQNFTRQILNHTQAVAGFWRYGALQYRDYGFHVHDEAKFAKHIHTDLTPLPRVHHPFTIWGHDSTTDSHTQLV